jgi:hypothetical protein
MNRLPKVLQTEIREYVRGDRAHWRNQFNVTMAELSCNFLRWLENQYLGGVWSLKKIIESGSVRKEWHYRGNFHEVLKQVDTPWSMAHVISRHWTFDFQWGRTEAIPIYDPPTMDRFGWNRIL